MKNSCHRFVLTGSVILNLLLAAIIIGHVGHCLIGKPSGPASVDALTAKLPEDRRKVIEDGVHAIWKDTESEHTDIAKDKDKAAALLKAEPFDSAAYIAQSQVVIDKHTQMRRHMAESVAALAAKLSADERVVLSAIVSQPPPSPQQH